MNGSVTLSHLSILFVIGVVFEILFSAGKGPMLAQKNASDIAALELRLYRMESYLDQLVKEKKDIPTDICEE